MGLAANLFGAIILAAISFYVWGTHLSRQLDQDWTEDRAWQVHNQQIVMLTIWIVLVWALIVVEIVA